MDVTVAEEPIGNLAQVARIPIAFTVDRILEVVDGALVERPAGRPWVKDYDAVPGHAPADWAQRFDVGNWGLVGARVDGTWAGTAVIAYDTPGLEMLGGRRDLAVLWDLRVHPARRGHGIGGRLFAAAADWARRRGCRRIEVETQNVNAAASHFYRSMGCELARIDSHAYPEHPGEVQLVWGLDL